MREREGSRFGRVCVGHPGLGTLEMGTGQGWGHRGGTAGWGHQGWLRGFSVHPCVRSRVHPRVRPRVHPRAHPCPRVPTPSPPRSAQEVPESAQPPLPAEFGAGGSQIPPGNFSFPPREFFPPSSPREFFPPQRSPKNASKSLWQKGSLG